MVGSHNQSNPPEPTLFDPEEDTEGFGILTEQLTPLESKKSASDDTDIYSEQSVSTAHNPFGPKGDPGLAVIFGPELHGPHTIEPFNPDEDTVMIDHADAEEATEIPDVQRGAESAETSGHTLFEAKLKECSVLNTGPGLDARELQKTATLGLRETTTLVEDEGGGENVPESRHDSAQEQELPSLPSEQAKVGSRRGSLSLTLVTNHETAPEESIATSPNLGKHVITMSSDLPETLPAFQHNSPTRDGSAGSPHGGTLPPIHQIVTAPPYRPLEDLAEIATQQEPRPVHQHSPPFGSVTSQSPRIPYHPYPSIAQMSPSSQHAYSARSSTSAFGDPYGSPTQFSHPVAYYPSRRSSAPTDRPTAPPPSIPSVSSSGDSHDHASSIDGYSTAHTTPIDPAEATPRPVLPPPHGMVTAPGYKCDVHDCQAAPFQTQYLLSSHKNVHTTLRPHFCPVKGCPRSEGGKGFKRKNEMIRHGLVHESPGYVCPFCPDREHRYPRPDNLQRHVRVHHVDKDRDDPELREVLAQRSQGSGKARRRRANTGGSSTG